MDIEERLKELRKANSVLWMRFPEILKEADPREYSIIMTQINEVETKIGWVIRDLSFKKACIFDLSYRESCFKDLRKLRMRNNTLWVALLEKTYDARPEQCRAILDGIAWNDRDILVTRREVDELEGKGKEDTEEDSS